jgi:hypothetical protein
MAPDDDHDPDAIDPTALADALDEMASVLARLRAHHERLREEKPYLLRDLERSSATLVDLDARLADLRARGRGLGARELSALATRVLALESLFMRMESVGLPRRAP